MRQSFTVQMDDGTEYLIESDGRDIRAWEAAYDRSWFSNERLSFTIIAQLAYLAGKRTEVLNGAFPTYEEFDAHCIDARAAKRDRPQVIADPIRAGATDDSSALSPTNSAVSRPRSNRRGQK